MKKLLFILGIISTTSSFICAQSPDRMSYQAVVRDASNELVENQDVGVQISILHNSTTGTVSYTESQTVTTNENGLLTLVVGDGNVVTGQMDTINWANGPYFIVSQIDPTGGANYTISGSSELLSVPYAFNANNGSKWEETGSDLFYDNGNTVIGTPSGTTSRLTVDSEVGQEVLRGNIDGTTAFLFDENGSFGLGTDNATKNFHLVHDQYTGLSAGGLAIENEYNNAQWTFYSSQSTSNLALYFNGGLRGNFDNVSGNYTSTSDERLKMNIVSLENKSSLEKLIHLEPKIYEYKSNPGKKYYGFIAQELQDVIPEVVTVNGNDGNGDEIENLLTVSYSEIIPIVVASIKEQQTTIEELKKENEELKTLLQEVLKKVEEKE
ncbi:MAG: tail fiber domain-containing protein [Brumimicrobium sp.]